MTDRELMQMALAALEDADQLLEDEGYSHALQQEALKALRDRLAQPEPKPLAWLNTEDWIVTREPPWADYEEPDPKQLEYMVPLYRIPPKREWVGLTWDEIDQLSIGKEDAVFNFARAIEAKLKEKNGG
jgi:hypothetical protein